MLASAISQPSGPVYLSVVARNRREQGAKWDVFLSHATEDSTAAFQLAALLTKRGLRIFLAEKHINVRIGSQQWSEAIDDALDGSASVVLLATSAALASEWVKYEWRSFHEDILAQRGGMLLPVCWNGPGPDELPRALRRHQCVDCRRGAFSETNLQQIEALVRGHLGLLTEPIAVPGLEPDTTSGGTLAGNERRGATNTASIPALRRRKWVIAVAGFLFLLGVVLRWLDLRVRELPKPRSDATPTAVVGLELKVSTTLGAPDAGTSHVVAREPNGHRAARATDAPVKAEPAPTPAAMTRPRQSQNLAGRAEQQEDAPPLPNSAFVESARLAFDEGIAEYRAGNFERACVSFETAQRLAPRTAGLVFIALCHKRQGRLVRALNEFEKFAADADIDQRRQLPFVEGEISQLKARIPSLRILPAPTPDVTVSIDGELVPSFAQPIPLDPGPHELISSAPEHQSHIEQFSLTEGTPHEIQLPRLAPMEHEHIPSLSR